MRAEIQQSIERPAAERSPARCLVLPDTPVSRSDDEAMDPARANGGCLHLRCRIEAGYLPRVAAYNAVFRDERQNWLRFVEDRRLLARTYWAGKRQWVERGRPVEPDQCFSMLFVWVGLSGGEAGMYAHIAATEKAVEVGGGALLRVEWLTKDPRGHETWFLNLVHVEGRPPRALAGVGFRPDRLGCAPAWADDGGRGYQDLELCRDGTGLFNGWTPAERRANLAAAGGVLRRFGVRRVPKRRLTWQDLI